MFWKVSIYKTPLLCVFMVFRLTSCLSHYLSLLSAKQQPARSVIVSGNVRCTAALSLYDVIWAKGCVNTALTLVLDLSIGLGWRTEKRIVLD